MLTFGDLKNSPTIRRVTPFSPDSEDFADLILTCVRRAMHRGDWSGTLVPIYLCLRNGCVVWPSFVKNVRAIAFCGGSLSTQNMWGGFIPRGRTSPWAQGLNWYRGGQCMAMMRTEGRSSLFQDIQGDGRLVRAYFRCNEDLNKTITLFGIDNNGQMLQHQDTEGNWLPGVVLTMQPPFASTSTYVRRIDYVQLDSMACPVNLYAYNASTNLLEDLAQYEPGTTRPDFARTRINIPGFMGSNGSCGPCCGKTGITALVKISYPQAYRFDSDLIPIDNLDAIKMLIQSIKFEDAGDRQNARSYFGDAIAELNRQLEDDFPDDQFVATDNVFGADTFTNKCF